MSKVHVLTVKSSSPIESITQEKIGEGTRLIVTAAAIRLTSDVPADDDMTVTVKSRSKTILSVRSHVQPERVPAPRIPDFDDDVLVENDIDDILAETQSIPPAYRTVERRKKYDNSHHNGR